MQEASSTTSENSILSINMNGKFCDKAIFNLIIISQEKIGLLEYTLLKIIQNQGDSV